jgi:NADH:ubiquinone oxidoreductase subunit 6 (subunit J)
MQAIATVGIRLLGAYLVISAIGATLAMWASWAMLAEISSLDRSFSESRAVVLVVQAAIGLFGFALIVLSARLSGFLTRGIFFEESVRPSNQQLVQVGTGLLGLYFLAVGVVWCVAVALLWFKSFSFLGAGQPDQTAETIRTTSNGGFALVRVIVGLGLCALARPFSRLPFAEDTSAIGDD